MESPQNPLRLTLFLFGLLTLALFVSLRVAYWNAVSEVPFSDMADYLSIAKGVLHQGSFQFDGFWMSYKPPTLPALGAAVFGVAGSEDLLVWRVALASFVLLGLVWVAYEIALATNHWWLGVLLILFVAISKSSIFWSLKFATEGSSEMFNYWSIALFLCALRTKRAAVFFMLGLILTASVLNRPQAFPILPLYLALAIFILARRSKSSSNYRPRQSCLLPAAFILGVSVCWAPWLIRSWRLYGHVLPFSTQGPYSFLWELGEVTNSAGTVSDIDTLQREAPRKFANDYEAAQYAQGFVSHWIRIHYLEYPQLVFHRLQRSFNEPGIDLSKVPRTILLGPSVDGFLLDKTPVFALAGITGLIVLIFYHIELGVLLISALAPWIFGALFISSPRLLEPYIPIILYGNCAWLLLISSLRRRL